MQRISSHSLTSYGTPWCFLSCLWSSTTLVDEPREEDDFYIGPRLEPELYAWGFLYSEEGLRYYSSKGFPDGRALCVREP